MKNKILVKVYVPSLDNIYEIYISVNETIKKNLELILKVINELSDSNFDTSVERMLVDMDTLDVYNDSAIIRDTKIRNSTKLLLI